jgi:hypothetical protein
LPPIGIKRIAHLRPYKRDQEVIVRISILGSGFTLGAVVALTAGSALAAGHKHHEEAESEYPVSYVERPLTLPRLALAPELELEFGRALGAATGLGVAGRETLAGINLGASFGITKDLEVGAFVLPLQFSPTVSYGSGTEPASNLQLFGTYRFFHNKQIEVGGRLRAYIITDLGVGAQFTPSVPLLVHLSQKLRLDVEVAVPISALKGVGVHLGLNVPVALSIDIIEPLHIGARTGLQIDDLGGGSVGKRFYVPLGLFAGYALGGKKPFLDIDGFFQFNHFAAPGSGAGADKIVAGDFQTGLAVRGYFYF